MAEDFWRLPDAERSHGASKLRNFFFRVSLANLLPNRETSFDFQKWTGFRKLTSLSKNVTQSQIHPWNRVDLTAPRSSIQSSFLAVCDTHGTGDGIGCFAKWFPAVETVESHFASLGNAVNMARFDVSDRFRGALLISGAF